MIKNASPFVTFAQMILLIGYNIFKRYDLNTDNKIILYKGVYMISFFKNNVYVKGLICGVLVLIFGFVAMGLLWTFTTTDSNLLGFYDYHAATWGDGLFLSILVGMSVFFIDLRKKQNEILSLKQLKKVKIVGILGGVIGFCIQMSWLIDKNIQLNWTIPRVNYFTIAGYYHAIFFVTMFFTISLLLSNIWYLLRIYKNENKSTLEIVSLVFIWFSRIWLFVNAFFG